jgi:glutamyl-tRNA(Gln) amidotransferase subunit E
MIVRSTGLVRTGAGAARQDVNVSVNGGTRIEIKGVPSLKRIPLLTYNEAMRQWNLLRLRDELNKRGITKETFDSKIDNITKLLKKTRYTPVRNAIDSGMTVNCVTLRGFGGLLRWKTQTDTYFSKEISDRVRVIACLNILPNIIHSDSTGETLNTPEWSKIKKAVGAAENDTIVIVWGSEKDVLTASNEIIIRAREAAVGIPSETRQALRNGTNGFERILPGADRMYPDTDLPPKRITNERIERIKNSLPELYYRRIQWYRELNIPDDVIQPLSISEYAPLFKKLVTELKINHVLASVVLIQYPKRLNKIGLDVSKINSDLFLKIFSLYRDKKISKDGILPLLKMYLTNNNFSLDELSYSDKISGFESLAEKVHINVKSMELRNSINACKLTISGIMNEVRLFIDGKYVSDYVVENFNMK